MTDTPLPGRRYSDAVYTFAAEQLQRSESSVHVQSMLVAKGLDEESAADVVSQPCAAQATDTARGQNMAIGASLCIVGVLVTVVTAIVASGRGGGVVVVMSGAIVFGAFFFFRSLWREES